LISGEEEIKAPLLSLKIINFVIIIVEKSSLTSVRGRRERENNHSWVTPAGGRGGAEGETLEPALDTLGS
jgi:hypothetical protein